MILKFAIVARHSEVSLKTGLTTGCSKNLYDKEFPSQEASLPNNINCPVSYTLHKSIYNISNLRSANIRSEEVDTDLGGDVTDEEISDGRNVTLLMRVDPKHVRRPESEQ